MRLSGEEIAMATKGSWLGAVPAAITGIGTDSRDFTDGQAFLALRGESFDGHQHAHQVVQQASALIGDTQGVKQWRELSATPKLEVTDTLMALGNIAAAHRYSLANTTFIAITGSYGKTTVRSMMAHVFKALGLEVSATKENFNNLIGVPKTVLNVSEHADVAIIECGISELGEMSRLSAIVQPDVAVVTGVSHAHGEGLGDLTGVAREKVKLLDHLQVAGWAVLGEGVVSHFEQAKCMPDNKLFSMNGDQTVTWQLNKKLATFAYAGQQETVELSLPAKHWAEDMAIVATVVLHLGEALNKSWSISHVAQSLQTWQAEDGRMCVYPSTPEKAFTCIDDSYNANPASMQAALDTLAKLEGYRVAVLGDMLELGEQSTLAHESLELHNIDEVILVGTEMQSLLKKHKKISWFENVDALLNWLESNKTFPKKESVVLIKSSHGTGLYKVANWLTQRGQYAL